MSASHFLIESLVRGGGFAMLVWVVYQLLRSQSSAAMRHACLAVALGILALIPVFVVAFGGWKVLPAQVSTQSAKDRTPERIASASLEVRPSINSAAPTESSSAEGASGANMTTEVARLGDGRIPANPDESKIVPMVEADEVEGFRWPSPEAWMRVIGAVWLLGLVVCLSAIAREMLRVRAWVKGNRICDDEAFLADTRIFAESLGIRRCPEVRITGDDLGPLVIGWMRPVMVFPITALDWPIQQRKAVILHEMAHVKRWDGLVQSLAAIVCAFHWINPCTWLLLKGMRYEAECACDDVVLCNEIEAQDYAKCLLAVASGKHVGSWLTPSMANSSGLKMRVQAILKTGVRRVALSRAAGISIAVTAVACSFPVMLAQKTAVDGLSESAAGSEQVESPVIPVDDVAEFIPDGELGEISLLVVDDKGKEVAGTVVRGFNTGRGEPVQPFQPDFIIRTGEDGRWKGELPLGRFMVLAKNGALVAASDNNQTWWNISKGKAKKDLKLILKKGGEVRVTVKDGANQKPTAGAQIILDSGHTAIADQTGTAVFHAVPQGKRTAKVVHPPYANRQQVFNTKDIPTASLDVALLPGFEVVGRVMDANGTPVKDAKVGDNYSGETFFCAMQKCVTDAEGRYQLGWYDRERGLWSFTVEHNDFAEQSKGGLRPPEDSNVAVWDFKLDKGWEIRGVVSDDDGKPVEGAVVRYGSSWSLVGAKWAKSDAEGRFHIVKIGGNSTWPVVAEAEGYAPGQNKVTPGKEEEVPDVGFRLKPGLVTKGRVVDNEGKPVNNVFISPRMIIDNRSEYVGGRMRVDKNGEFQIKNLPASGVSLDMYGNGISAIRDMPFDPTKPLTLIAEKPGVIIGTVLDAETRKPVEKFSVTLGLPKKPKLPGAPDPSFSSVSLSVKSPEGRFLWEDLINRAGHEVTIKAKGYPSKTVDYVEAKSATDQTWPVEILLHRGITIQTEFRDATTNSPISGAKILWVPSEKWVTTRILRDDFADTSRSSIHQNVLWTHTDEKGKAQVNLPDGTPFYSLVVVADGYAPQLFPGQAATKLTLPVVTLQRGAKIRGKVSDVADFDLESDAVIASTPNFQTNGTLLKKDGSFEIGGLPLGKVKINIYSKNTGKSKISQHVMLDVGETKDIKIEAE